jgi:phenylalanyl-tRNA synthetase beta subunit
MSDKDIVQALEQAGVEVEQYIASTQLDKSIVVGLVKKVVQHPGADRLNIVDVSTGDNELSIVCGAPNVHVGMKVAVAQVGSTLPDGMVIKKSKLRGELSVGMLCSASELGLGNDHNGLIDLGSEAVLGTSLCDMYENHGIVDVKTAANRSDLQSVIGLSREVAAIANVGLRKLVEPPVIKANGPTVEIEASPSLVSRLLLAEFDLGASGKIDLKLYDLIAERLRASGVRPISPVVDVTNYVMLEYGQPLHAYDADKVTLPLGSRLAKIGESLVTLDGVRRDLTEEDMVITDQTGVIGLAGVMGGAGTEISSGTKRIYLEAATFNGGRIRKTAQRFGLRSEASARFERGLPVQLAPLGLARAAELLNSVAGAEIQGGVTDVLNVWPWTQRIGLRMRVLNQLLGYELTAEAACKALAWFDIAAVPFDIALEARSHLGKPYIWGASFKKNGTDGFDCSYFTDYIYSLIGQRIGYTSLAQFEIGTPVELDDLRPGDVLFYNGSHDHVTKDYDLAEVGSGNQHHSIEGYYYLWSEPENKYLRVESKLGQHVGHNGLYIGEGHVVHAVKMETHGESWRERVTTGVVEEDMETFTKNPGFLGARRFVDDIEDYISVPAVPWWRTDLKLSVDLVEEIVRVLGYDRVPSTLPVWRPRALAFDQTHRLKTRIKSLLSGAGLFEIMTYSFVGEDQLAAVRLKPDNHLKLQNPLSIEQAYLRTSMLPSHLQVLVRNRNYARSVGYYELSKVFLPVEGVEQPNEPMRLAILVTRHQDAYRSVKGLLDALCSELNVAVAVTPSNETGAFAQGRAARISLAKQTIGTIGQLDPTILRNNKIIGEAAYLELDIEPILAAASPRRFAGLSRFPGTSRDITIVVGSDVTWSRVQAALKGLHNSTVAYVGEYAGANAPSGSRSLTIRLTLSFPDRTPTDKEAERMESQAWTTLERTFGIKR